jgi:hypothetical protein
MYLVPIDRFMVYIAIIEYGNTPKEHIWGPKIIRFDEEF